MRDILTMGCSSDNTVNGQLKLVEEMMILEAVVSRLGGGGDTA